MTDTIRKGVILAADDTPTSLKLLNDILVAEGYEVRAAISGKLALYAAELDPPDLILLDINMPDMNGFEVCARLKEMEHTRDIPVIFVSAFSAIEEILKGFERGAVDYVTKPFHREELLARVHTHIELNRLRHHLEKMVEERTRSLRESEEKLKSTLNESVSTV